MRTAIRSLDEHAARGGARNAVTTRLSKFRGLWRTALLCLLLATACDESPTGPSVPLDTQFTLAQGQVAVIEGTGVRLEFNGVENDSRCPADAVCVHGGDALVRVVVIADGARQDYDIHTGDMEPVRHDNLTIALVDLSPYPFSSRPIAPDDYRATLRVTDQ